MVTERKNEGVLVPTWLMPSLLVLLVAGFFWLVGAESRMRQYHQDTTPPPQVEMQLQQHERRLERLEQRNSDPFPQP